MTVKTLSNHPVHLGLGAKALSEPEFTGEMSWYQAYQERHDDDGAEARLVSLHTFREPWGMWEMHPDGDEVVICVSGALTLYQEDLNGRVTTKHLNAGDYAINERGIWHTADTDGTSTVIFITAGLGTQHRPRDSTEPST